MKKITTLLMMFALMLVLAACGAKEEKAPDTSADGNKDEPKEVEVEEENTTVEITHELDKEPIVLEKNPGKVVVFDFGILDTLDELGVEVAGVPQKNVPSYLSKYEDAKYENVGGLKEPDFEAIHAMQPDVIFISGRQADMYEELSEIAPTIYVGVDTSNYMESFKANMEMVAELFNKEDEMKAELADIETKIAAVKEKTDSSDEKALIILGNEGKVSAYGPSSRFGIIHDVFGFKAADEKIEVSTHGQNISFEYILETNPDVLFVVDRDAAIGGDASAKDSLENDIVKKTNAYQNDKIHYLDPNYWYLSGGGLLSIKEMIKEIEAAL
ncbi:siderophore ABC transporter substrate-binding protein [Sporosarcina sp. G11-34]|uniref:siderophore ABC transporter substrate-binding protein n=1 Tax=Sporosarcina sp. G11-34 TaxID=2849605 RepID=UPI0022A8E861|nr:siderophore ABC transporter substrate-binding protein [Sporosarcina sp. G11-34]MCZ2260360.1 siderophore ABC transporter substrate-binding protein [Sporosarcina sp. G11-34]